MIIEVGKAPDTLFYEYLRCRIRRPANNQPSTRISPSAFLLPGYHQHYSFFQNNTNSRLLLTQVIGKF